MKRIILTTLCIILLCSSCSQENSDETFILRNNDSSNIIDITDDSKNTTITETDFATDDNIYYSKDMWLRNVLSIDEAIDVLTPKIGYNRDVDLHFSPEVGFYNGRCYYLIWCFAYYPVNYRSTVGWYAVDVLTGECFETLGGVDLIPITDKTETDMGTVNENNKSPEQEDSEPQDNIETNPLYFIYDYLEILAEEYPSPMGVREDLISLCSDFDYNNDGINDYMVSYGIYMQFIFVIFDGTTKEVLYQENIMMMFIPEATKMEIYLNRQRDVLFWFSKRYQDVAASTAKTEKVQICGKDVYAKFEAVYDFDDVFCHAYDKYQTEEEYIAAYMKLLEGYEFYDNIIFEELTQN